jgi:hypothetical protein
MRNDRIVIGVKESRSSSILVQHRELTEKIEGNHENLLRGESITQTKMESSLSRIYQLLYLMLHRLQFYFHCTTLKLQETSDLQNFSKKVVTNLLELTAIVGSLEQRVCGGQGI